MKLTTSVHAIQTRLTPVEAYQLLRGLYGTESFLLESVEGTTKTARYSFIGLKPVFVFRSKGTSCEYSGERGLVKQEAGDPYALLQAKHSEFSAQQASVSAFSGGFVGYFSYDMARFFEKLPSPPPDDLNLPDSYFIVPEVVVVFDHLHQKTLAIGFGEPSSIAEVKRTLESVPAPEAPAVAVKPLTSNGQKNDFEQTVGKVKEFILAGDAFQVVLSRRKEVEFEGDPLAFYVKLREINPSPYMFYLDFGQFQLLGSSPEMLVRLEGSTLTTRPIAGTRPRDKDVEEDEKLKVELLLDEKERAEHLMLVDLHRNDLSRVSEYGSVKVDEFMAVEKYSHVQHIVSNVTGKLREGKNAFDALKACFPAGTVTGAPKVRAMQLIDEFEHQARGPYGGVVGYFDFSGNADFAITIRSVVVSGNKAFLQAGAGIVYDSLPEKELVETEGKLQAVVEALGGRPT